MRLLRLILLTGTVLPGLTLVQPASAAPGRILLAQGGPDERGPRGGEPPHGGPRPERPPQERPGPPPGPPAARERPEPRSEHAAPPARERPEPPAQRPTPSEPPPRERAPERRPEPAAPRPPTQERPEQRPERQQDRRDQQPDRPDRIPPGRSAPTRPGPDQPPAPDRDHAPQTRPNPERPPAAQQRQAPDRDRPGPDAQPNRPVQRDAVPDRTPPDRGPPGQRPDGPGAPGDRRPPPDAAPGGPGQRPDGARENRQFETRPQPNAGPATEPGRPAPPNVAPGIPGRPFQPQNAQPDAHPPARPNGTPGAEPGRPLPPNMAPGIPGRPFVPPGQAPGQAPPGGSQPGLPPAGGPGVSPGPGAFNRPGQPGYVPGGFRQNDAVRDFEQVRTDRREFTDNGRTYYREPGRIIVQDRDGYLIRHDENERFRYLDPRGYRFERQGADFYSYLDRPGGEQVVTVTDDEGRLLRRYLRYSDGREIVLIDNSYAGPLRPVYDDVVVLPPPEIRIPRDRYVLDYAQADEGEVYEALTAPPVVAVDRRYTLDQIRYSPDLRARLRSVDINTITFDTGSFTVTPDQAAKLSVIAAAMNRAIQANPREVFLIEGFTDAVGSAIDNLSLSDRRAQSVATVLTQQFQVPPENLTTQGYGEQYLKVNTQGPSRENRRVVVQRITPLLQQGQGQAAPPPPR
ncbi:OmpA family protein [Methylobacterium phyllostachyos]|uniref:OmpA family protein n=1 Tax=Methylobacterium phyllostachyos TaxID=582672 RepID=UPI000B893DEF|nr:OmpA family protein [Methylobacterium phyllostachyos]